MASITEAKNIKPGDWILPDGSEWPSEVARVSNCNRVPDPWTGELKMTHRRFYFDTRTDAKPGAVHNRETLIVTY